MSIYDPDLDEQIEDFALIPSLERLGIPLEEEVAYRKALLQNIVNSSQLIAERVAQGVQAMEGSDSIEDSNAPDFQTWDYLSE